MLELIKDILNLPSIQEQGQKCLNEIDSMISKIRKFVKTLKIKKKEDAYENE